MGETIEFGTSSARGYLATGGERGCVLVIQEWWGLVPHIEEVCDRFAAQGFTAFAPDLFHGQRTTEPDEARKLMMQLDMARAAGELGAAIDALHGRGCDKIGTVGFCMGGALSLVASTVRDVDATVCYYGLPQADVSNIPNPVLGHFAEHDDWASPDNARKVFSALADATMYVYPGTQHAFFNDTRPEVYDEGAARASWDRTLDFFRQYLA